MSVFETVPGRIWPGHLRWKGSRIPVEAGVLAFAQRTADPAMIA